MELRLLVSGALLAATVFGSACGEGSIGDVEDRGSPRSVFNAGDTRPPALPGEPPLGPGGQCSSVGFDPVPPCDSASYYVAASGGSDSSPGTSASPWASISHARSNAPSGATICVRTGNYGSFSESAPPAIAQPHVIRAEPGQTPTVSSISINYASQTDAKLTLSGFTVHKTSGGAGRLINIQNADNLRITGVDASSYKWAVAGVGVECVRVEHSDNVMLDHTKCHNVHVGSMFQNTDGLRLLNNNFEVTAGSGIRNVYHNTNAEVSYNHIHGADWSPDGDSPDHPHASIISNRSGSITIRGNHMHGMGNSSGVMFYDNDPPLQYNDILFENNLIYDTINIYAMRIYGLGTNVTIRNNVFYPGLEPGTCPDGSYPDSRYRMRNGFIVHNKIAGPGLNFYNNIVAGMLILSSANINEERNNYAWSWLNSGSWASTSPSGTSTIVHSTGGNCSSSSIFEDGTFFNAPIDAWFPGRQARDLTLAEGSAGWNYGDPSVQPSESIGSLDADGFVRPGPCRSSDTHSVGPSEFRE